MMTRHRVNVEIEPDVFDRDEVSRMVERAVGGAADVVAGDIVRCLSWDMKTAEDARMLRDRLSAGFPYLRVFLEVDR